MKKKLIAVCSNCNKDTNKVYLEVTINEEVDAICGIECLVSFLSPYCHGIINGRSDDKEFTFMVVTVQRKENTGVI